MADPSAAMDFLTYGIVAVVMMIAFWVISKIMS